MGHPHWLREGRKGLVSDLSVWVSVSVCKRTPSKCMVRLNAESFLQELAHLHCLQLVKVVLLQISSSQISVCFKGKAQ